MPASRASSSIVSGDSSGSATRATLGTHITPPVRNRLPPRALDAECRLRKIRLVAVVVLGCEAQLVAPRAELLRRHPEGVAARLARELEVDAAAAGGLAERVDAAGHARGLGQLERDRHARLAALLRLPVADGPRLYAETA